MVDAAEKTARKYDGEAILIEYLPYALGPEEIKRRYSKHHEEQGHLQDDTSEPDLR